MWRKRNQKDLRVSVLEGEEDPVRQFKNGVLYGESDALRGQIERNINKKVQLRRGNVTGHDDRSARPASFGQPAISISPRPNREEMPGHFR